MAPEQAWGQTREIGPLSDQYALGAILYEMLVGRPPFQGANPLETLELVRNQEPVPPTRLQPKVPTDLETICLKSLQKDPAKRFPDAAAMAEDLRRFLDGEPIVARPVGTPERLWRWCKRNPRVAVLAAAVVLMGFAITVGSVALRRVAEDAQRRTRQVVQGGSRRRSSRRRTSRRRSRPGTRRSRPPRPRPWRARRRSRPARKPRRWCKGPSPRTETRSRPKECSASC